MRHDNVPPWARIVQAHGEPDEWDTGVVRDFSTPAQPAGWTPTGPSPGTRNSQRPSGLVVWIGLSMVVLAVIVGAGLVLANGKDSGVAACQAIAEGRAADGSATTPGAKMTESEYKELREIFASSADPAIRDHGSKIIDLAWQLQQNPDAALLVARLMAEAYTGLAGACAAHGHVIPPLGAE